MSKKPKREREKRELHLMPLVLTKELTEESNALLGLPVHLFWVWINAEKQHDKWWVEIQRSTRYSSCYNKLFTFCELKMNWIKMFTLLESHYKVISCQSIVVWSNIKSFRKLKNLMEMFTINIFLIIISMHFSTAKENTLYKCSSKVIMMKYT